MTEPTRRLGKYEIIDEIGKGGFATVYRARDMELERDVALKILDPLLTRDPVWVARFRREARAVASLDHPRIVTIHEIGQSEGMLFIAMKLIDGGSLAQYLAQNGRVSWSEAVRLVGEIAAGLDFAHGQGVVHRDLKPANVLLDSRTGAVLTDFGFARLVADNSMSISMSGGVVGTPAYIAPEVWEGQEPTPQADIYALGCMVYEMIAGRPLFTGATPPAVMLAHFKPPALPETWSEGVPSGVSELLATALDKDPTARFTRAGDFAEALAGLAEDELAKPYAALLAAIAAQAWPEAMALAGDIRAKKPDYRDVVALERQAAAGVERAARTQSAAQWRATAEEALASGDLAGAQVAVKQWQQILPDDPALAAFKAQLDVAIQPTPAVKQPISQSQKVAAAPSLGADPAPALSMPQGRPTPQQRSSSGVPDIVPPPVQSVPAARRSRATLGVIALVGVALLSIAVIRVFTATRSRESDGSALPTAIVADATVAGSLDPSRAPAVVSPTQAPIEPAPTVPAAPTESAEPTPTEVVLPTLPPLPKVLRVNLGTYPDIIDPQKSSFANEIAHLRLIYEGLTRQDNDLNTVSGAAVEWEYNDDATQLVFTLRPGLKYSDGKLLNAERYAYAIRRNINPETSGEYAAITDDILGAPEWRGCDLENDRSGCDSAAEVVNSSVRASRANGAACEGYEDAACNTLSLTFSKPAPYFHTVMSLWVTFPAREELISDGGDNWWNSSKYQIGNGPYILQNLEPSVRAYFTPNANYWRGAPAVDIEYSYINDSAGAFEAYKNDEFDVVGLAAEDIEVVQADRVLSHEAMIYPGACTFALMFHQLKEPFTDQKVREAFAMSFDREAWVRDVLRGLGAPTLTWIPPGYPGYDAAENRWNFDPAAAKQALAESSYGGVEGLPPITLTFSDSPRNRTRNEWLAVTWKKYLGVDLMLDPVEPTTYTALTRAIDTAPQTFILGWCADYPDPHGWLSVYWKTGSGFAERIGYSNPDFDRLTNAADTTVDPDVRAELYADAQELLTDGVPVVFAWNNVNAYLVKPWVQGIVTTSQDLGFPGSNDLTLLDIDTSLIPR